VNIASDNVKYRIEEKVSDSFRYENVLLILDVIKDDYGMYQCIVTNAKGEDRLPIIFDDTSKFATQFTEGLRVISLALVFVCNAANAYICR